MVNSKAAAVAFINTPGFELVLRQSASEMKNVRPIAAVAISKIFIAASNPTLATEACCKILLEKLDSTDFNEKEAALLMLTAVTQADCEVGGFFSFPFFCLFFSRFFKHPHLPLNHPSRHH